MSSTRCGISAKQLEREIGVTYKTAHRMFKQIRTLLADDDDGQLDGDVEVDESAYGGNFRATETHAQRLKQKSYRPTILAMVERGGRVRPLVVPDRGGRTVGRVVREHVLPSSMLFTDEFTIYESIGRDYRGHRRIKHNRSTRWARPIRRPSRASLACLRPACTAYTTRSARTTCRPTWTSTPSAITGASRGSPCSRQSSIASRRR